MKDIDEVNKELSGIEVYCPDEKDRRDYHGPIRDFEFEDLSEDPYDLDEKDLKKLFDENPLGREALKRKTRAIGLLDRIPPHDLDAEMRILGIYLVHPEKRKEKRDRRLSGRFYHDHHEKIHRVMIGLKHLDIVLLADALRKRGDLESVGGVAYLGELYKLGQDVNPKHLKDYVRIVREQALRRELIHYSSEALRFVYCSEEGIGELVT